MKRAKTLLLVVLVELTRSRDRVPRDFPGTLDAISHTAHYKDSNPQIRQVEGWVDAEEARS
jgi:hypothetical protein